MGREEIGGGMNDFGVCTKMVGKDNHQSKLTTRNVRAIRRARERGITLQKLADRYGVSREAIRHIERGVTWKHVK